LRLEEARDNMEKALEHLGDGTINIQRAGADEVRAALWASLAEYPAAMVRLKCSRSCFFSKSVVVEGNRETAFYGRLHKIT
jgi:hypothetical protein